MEGRGILVPASHQTLPVPDATSPASPCAREENSRNPYAPSESK